MDLEEPIEITTALYELCVQNDRPASERDKDVNNIQKCLISLNENKPFKAKTFYNQVPFGGMGCFNDWGPRITYNNPSNKYNGQSFEYICKSWSNIMRQIKP